MRTTSLVDVADTFLTPATLAMNLWPAGHDKWLPAKHLLYTSAKIATAIHRGSGRLIISMPPRHGKSRLVSEATIPWFIEKFPGRNIIYASYNSEQAEKFGRPARDVILSNPNLFTQRIRKDAKRVDMFITESGSECYFLGLNSGATGKGAHLLIVDDYIKGIEEAMSPAHLQKLWLNFTANLDSRLEKDATVIIVATRWAKKDLIGRIINHPNEEIRRRWEYIKFPAIATSNDILGRKPGDPLFPERFGLDRLDEIRQMREGTFLWNSLYQQEPIDDISSIANGDWVIVEDITRIEYEQPPVNVRAWDMAATQGGGDYTTGVKMEANDKVAYITDIRRAQLSPSRIEDLIRKTAELDGQQTTILIEQEPGSQGKALIEHLTNNILHEFTVIPVPVGGKSQIVRVQPFLAAVEFGRVRIASPGGRRVNWVATFIDEFDEYPPSASGHDDQVVAASIAFNYLQSESTKVSPVWWKPNIRHSHYVYDTITPSQQPQSKFITGCIW